MMDDDMALIGEFARSNSEAAFAELVRRHINLVYSVARRHVGNSHLAEDITQSVFIILARKADTLGPGTILPAWLCRTARHVSINALKMQHRRERREHEAFMQSHLQEPEPDAWRHIAPLLDDALDCLGKKDHAAVVLRFFEGRDLKQVGAALGLREDAARMRINRSLGRLRKFFLKRGVALSAAAIAGAMAANSVQAAPAALARSVTAAGIAKGSIATASTSTLVKGALKIMAWTGAKTAITAGTAIALAAVTATLAVKHVSHQREEARRETSVWNGITGNVVQQLWDAEPTVSIRPTKYSHDAAGSMSSYGKVLGICQPFTELLGRAYDVSETRILPLTPLPDGNYDFIASIPAGQKEALQARIESRFGLTARHETRSTDVLVLTVGRRDAPGLTAAVSQDGSSLRVAGLLKHTSASAGDLAGDLEHYLQVPVIDRTGLAGRYDVDLKWTDELTWDGTGRSHFSNPDGLKAALMDRLGLQLAPGREPVDMLVVKKK